MVITFEQRKKKEDEYMVTCQTLHENFTIKHEREREREREREIKAILYTKKEGEIQPVPNPVVLTGFQFPAYCSHG